VGGYWFYYGSVAKVNLPNFKYIYNTNNKIIRDAVN